MSAANSVLTFALAALPVLGLILVPERMLFLLVVAIAPYAQNPWITTAVGISATPVLIAVLGISVLGRRLVRGMSPWFPRMLLPAGAFITIAIVSVVYASNKIEVVLSVERAALRMLVFPYLGWLLVRTLPPAMQARFIHWILAVLIGAAFVGGAIAFLQFVWKHAYWLPDEGAFLTYRNQYLFRPISLAESPTTWGIFLILPTALALVRLARNLNVANFLLFTFFFSSLILSGTRSAWIGMLVALTWLLAFRWRKPRLLTRVTLSLIAALAFLLMGVTPARQAALQRWSARTEGLEGRRPIIGAGLSIIARHPFVGVGAGNFASYVVANPEVVDSDEVPNMNADEGIQSHNSLVGVLAETGVVGLAVFSWYLVMIWKSFSRSARLLRVTPSQISPFLVDGLQVAFLGCWIASIWQRIDDYLFVWLMPALALMLLEYARSFSRSSSLAPDIASTPRASSQLRR